MVLDTTTQRELLDLLAPLVERERDRRTLLATALGTESPALRGIEWSGPVEPFILRMIGELVRFGEAQPGEQALWKLLEAMRTRVGVDRQSRIDALKPIVNQPAALTASVSTGTPPNETLPLHLRVFLASPGDVADERALARQALERLPYDPLLRGQVLIEPVAWDQPGAGVPMLATMTPQAAIEAGLPKPSECDIVVAIFWARMGRPLPPEYRKPDGSPYLSGTEWEYLNALAAAERGGKPEILVYRRTEKFLIDSDDPEFDEKRQQRERVKAFFAGFYNPDSSIRGGYNEYAAPEDFRQQLDLHLRSVVRRLQEGRRNVGRQMTQLAAPAPVPPLWKGSPFPGLRAFTPDDAPIFFGRGRETDELLRKLTDPSTHLLIVVGASGSGKSSLVAAGLLPRLKDNAIEGSKDWVLPHVVSSGEGERKQWAGLRFTPGELGDNPLVALAARLVPMLPQQCVTPRRIADQLEAEPDAIAQLADSVLNARPAWAELLMFVDQFEELFSVVAERYRGSFIDVLAAAARTPGLRIVATVRADFYHRCLERPKLAALVRIASFPLAAPGLAALFEMVSGPAARAGLALDEGLPARILEDTGNDPGALALLAFALHELYNARKANGRLTNDAYAGFGGVKGAISQRAEDTFARLPATAKTVLPGVFRELVEVDPDGVATRRRASYERVVSTAEARALVDAFIEARLLVTDQSLAGAVVAVAHEALLREWPRMKAWVIDIADDLRLWRQAEASAAEWERSGQDPTYLWPQERLVLAQRALDELGIDRAALDEPVGSFLRPEAERLLEELERPKTSHYRRAEIGDRLDRIGDPRPGVGLRTDRVPDIVWCEVPGGNVTLAEDAGTFQVERFFIAKYPITFRQYKAFLDEPDGYANGRWWEDLEHEPDPGEQYRPVRNCPADNVSWHDAIAYCRWLGYRLGFEVLLPTEWQWQQAATGGHADRAYPWGPEWIEGRANTAESRLSRTTAVGMYPDGAAPHGALDLSGNVCEWCLNRYDPAGHISMGGPDTRVVRGGSWGYDLDYARSAARDYGSPDSRYFGIGLRVSCSSPID